MPKEYVLDEIINLFGRLKFNYIDGYDENNSPIYYIARLEWHGKAINGGAQKQGMTFKNIGTTQSVPFTPKEICLAVKNNLGNTPANKLCDLYIELIDEDISQLR